MTAGKLTAETAFGNRIDAIEVRRFAASEVRKELSARCEKVPLPMRPDDVVVTYADVTGLKQAAGFVPCTTLETAIRRFLEWCLETTPGG